MHAGMFYWCLPLVSIAAQDSPKQTTFTSFVPSTIHTAPWFGPTPAPSTSLSCTGGSTVLTTKDCTYGFPISYCYSHPQPVACSTGSYPAWIQARCYSWQACFPVPTTTRDCYQGEVPIHTYTDYDGTLAGGFSTKIVGIECACTQGWVSWQQTSPWSSYCLPTATPGSPCADYFTTSADTFSYTASSSVITVSHTFCLCPSGQTPSYALATGIATCASDTALSNITATA